MEATIKVRFEDGLKAPLSWSPTEGGRRSIICFEDHLIEDLGADESGSRFAAISEKMISGGYYPPDAVQFFGLFQDEHRSMQIGDRVQQRAPIFGGLFAWSMVEIYIADLRNDYCRIG